MPPGVPGAPWDWRFGLLNVGGGALAFGGGAFFEGFGGGGVAFFAFAAGLAPPNENAGLLAGAGGAFPFEGFGGGGVAFFAFAAGLAAPNDAGFLAAGGGAFLPFDGGGAAFDLAANGFAKAGFFAAGAGAAFLPFGGATTFLIPFDDALTGLGGGLAFDADVAAAGFAFRKLNPWQPRAATRRRATVRIVLGVPASTTRYDDAQPALDGMLPCTHFVATRSKFDSFVSSEHGNNGTLQRTGEFGDAAAALRVARGKWN